MTRIELQTALRSRYDQSRWTLLLRRFLPATEIFAQPQPLAFGVEHVVSATQIARIPLTDGRIVAVLEVRVSGQIDLQRNRVGLRNLVARFINQQQAHAVLGFFLGDDSDYRFSFVARTSEIGADGQLSHSETAPRRYTYLLGPGQSCRTLVERLEILRTHGASARLDDLVAAFRVEPLFKEFFSEYGRVFDQVENHIRPTLADKEILRLFTQRLFNRLMFLAFIGRKGWLRFGSRSDYLAALWDDYCASLRTTRPKSSTPNFYHDRLIPLFFEGLNQPDRPIGSLDVRFGSVPYLNGGLFERADDGSDNLPAVQVPDEALAAILDPESGLFSRYNFTVAESTPLEIDVAVDPEMLGKVFEELVTGRHEQGSYYTPKPIVSFMCRAALVEFLADRCPREPRTALETFVHEHKAGDLRDAEAVLAALRAVTVCDPACGSGAYLLGMLHELLDLRTCLFAAIQKLTPSTAHDRKLEIIERNLYGVDLDAFAVNIARLRLWLSLAVEYEGVTPPPLPNLDFKIERGDALAARAPADVMRDEGSLIADTVREFRLKKAAYLRAHGTNKDTLRAEIATLKIALKGWLSTEGPASAFHWAIEFAEIFLPTPSKATLSGEFNLGQELAPAAVSGGFDIVVANPPYVRMELIKPQKPILRKRFPSVHAERADLYIYFYARAHELLRPGGVAAFISSNKWLRAGYGELLRQHLLDSQAFRLVMDFGELPVFESAATDAAIFLWQKQPRNAFPTAWAMVKDLDRCYAEGVRTHFSSLRIDVPATQFGKGKLRLATTATADIRGRMESSGPRLGELFNGRLGYGIKTGLNDAFIINAKTKESLIAGSPDSARLIKPMVFGDDIRHFELHYRDRYLIYTYHGIDMKNCESVLRYLAKFRTLPPGKDGKPHGLDHRATRQEWWELQQPQKAYEHLFAAPKILYPDIGKESRFTLDTDGFYPETTGFVIGTADWFILAVLNSSSAWTFFKEECLALGDKDEGGRLRLKTQYIENLPIPNAPSSERHSIGELAKKAQALHGQRRICVERFLIDIGLTPAGSNSRSPLEQPWSLSAVEFAKRARKLTGHPPVMSVYEAARDETAALTEKTAKIEAEIDARVATLYGLDAEDRRWASQVPSSAKSDDKQALFFRILGKLKEQHAYFPVEAIQTAANDEELALKDSSLKVYLSEAVKQGYIHDAGRGWYSRLSDRIALDPKPVAKLIRTVEKAFPLLDFTVWSTAQINPWMHHLLAQPVAFLHAPADTLESVGDTLRKLGWEVAVNPPPSTGPKTVRPGEKTVVLRPTLSKQPPADGRQAPIEKILVDLMVETPRLALMDKSDAEGVSTEIFNQYLLQVAQLQTYADSRKVKIGAIDSINYLHFKPKRGVS